MSSTRGRRPGLGLLIGLWATTACFDPEDQPPLAAEAETEAATTTGEPAADSGGESSSSDDGAAAEQCTQYCEVMGDHCEGLLEQYPGQAICESVCALMSPGQPGDVLGNSAACRLHHALLAAESSDPHCHHAGPTGDTTCGGPCENFCFLANATCGDELSPFDSIDGCIEACEGWNPEPRYFATVEDADTYACRMHHLTLASLQPEVHCSHIGEDSPVCN